MRNNFEHYNITAPHVISATCFDDFCDVEK
jgi:hypothetical protein